MTRVATRQCVVTSLIERSEKHDLADRVLVITGRPGRIKEDITVQLEGPRSYERLISSTSAAALKGHVFHLVREEAMKTMEATPPQ